MDQLQTTLARRLSAWDYAPLFGGRPGAGPAAAGSGSAETPARGARPAHDDAFYALKTRLHQRLLGRIDLAAAENLPPEALRAQLADLLGRLIDEDALPVNGVERRQLVAELQNEILGLGPLEPLLADPAVTEIMVNGAERVYVERGGRIERTAVRFNDDDHVRKIIDKIVSRIGRRIDESSPMADARLPDGSRVNAVIPPVTLDGPSLSIRRFAVVPLRMPDLLAHHTLTSGMAEFLAGLVRAKVNVVISGGTGSGKTTLLNILSACIPADERILTIEDTAELQLQQPHVVRMETRPANIEGRGEIPMRALVRNSLRMRPDRIVLGEVRGAEVVDMLQAMNTGHEGSLTTIHANSAREALLRLENLMALGSGSLSPRSMRQQISAAVQAVVQTARLADGSRRVTSVHEITGMEGDVISSHEVFLFEQTGIGQDGTVQGEFRATGVRPVLCERLKRYGIEFGEHLFAPKGVTEGGARHGS
ncbi:MAG: CpaF family protein [Rhodocyclaceae bacterium]|nr:CpaF family protein [Rhodocyclaceae bacterium]